MGESKDVEQAVKQMKEEFDCDDVGELTEYVGCKVDINMDEMRMKFTQPVMIQSFKD